MDQNSIFRITIKPFEVLSRMAPFSTLDPSLSKQAANNTVVENGLAQKKGSVSFAHTRISRQKLDRAKQFPLICA